MTVPSSWPGQEVIRFNKLESWCLEHALAQQIGMRGAKDNDQAVTWLCRLDDLGADQNVAAIPSSPIVGAWLLLPSPNGQDHAMDDVVLENLVRKIVVTDLGEKPARPDNLLVDCRLGLVLGIN